MAIFGLYGRKFLKKNPEDFFLGSRSLKGFMLLATMAASNFSAFTIFGFSGAAYRLGYSFYPIMAFGTGFMALTFVFIGHRVWELGKKKSYITPPELMGKELESPALRVLVLIVMLIFSLPYIAIQPIAAGYALETLLGIPYFAGATLVTLFIVFYTLLGGLRTVAWTDLFQGLMMLFAMTFAIFGISKASGGFTFANENVFAKLPELFSRPGMNTVYNPSFWFSYMILWFFCDPLFPQLFQRFFAAKDKKAINKVMIFYPAITAFFFLIPVVIGVIGHVNFPDLATKAESDNIFSLLVNSSFSPAIAAFIMAAGLAALMSTMDSQLLTLSSMFTKDIYEPLFKKKTKDNKLAKLFTIFLAGVGLLIAFFNESSFNSSILEITTQTFTGLAVLFPSLFAILYWKNVTSTGAITSILTGEILLILYYFNILDSGNFLPVIPILIFTTFTLIVVSLITVKNPRKLPPLNLNFTAKWAVIFTILFLLSLDFWNWNKTPILLKGLPLWIYYFLALNLVLALAMKFMSKDLQNS